jgi:hypothetical protein
LFEAMNWTGIDHWTSLTVLRSTTTDAGSDTPPHPKTMSSAEATTTAGPAITGWNYGRFGPSVRPEPRENGYADERTLNLDGVLVEMAAVKRRGWSWAALIGVLVLLAAAAPTWGFSIFLCPLTLALSAVAWFRSDRDGVFWVGLAANVLLVAFCVSFVYEGT